MSFLNPVNEPVLRFSSTDADAPQINYNARTAGDVATVVKACLVTGYGAKASAGWTVTEPKESNDMYFVSPNPAMSDYKICLYDVNSSYSLWYYNYQNVETVPQVNSLPRNISLIDKTHPSNGWQMFVTSRGFLFVELLQSTVVNKLTARITYFGQVKSGLIGGDGQNIMFSSFGHAAPMQSYDFFSVQHQHIRLNNFTIAKPVTIGATGFGSMTSVSVIDIASDIFILDENNRTMLAALPCMYAQTYNNLNDMFGVKDATINGRQSVVFTVGSTNMGASEVSQYAKSFGVYTDYWEY